MGQWKETPNHEVISSPQVVMVGEGRELEWLSLDLAPDVTWLATALQTYFILNSHFSEMHQLEPCVSLEGKERLVGTWPRVRQG